jgi:hypothetical protein
MRLVFWVLVVVALGYAAYSGMISVWSYISVATAVDDAFQRGKSAGRPDAHTMKEQILQMTNEAGVPLTDHDVTVTETERTLEVYVVWSVPVIIVKGESVLAVPLSVRRSLDLGDAPAAASRPARKLPAPRR